MPTTNYYFNNYDYFGEQSLVESLITESIKIYGIQCYYMPRTFENSDTSVFGEDRLSKFDNAFAIEMYIKSVDGFEGEGDFLSKFGLEVRDEMILTVSRRRFSEELFADDTTPVDDDEGSGRPVEGDLLYFPLNGKIFQVKFVEHESIFYQMGTLQTYDIKLELFEYSNEILATGIAEIDDIGIDYSTDILDNQISLEFYTTFASAESRLNANVTVDRGEVTNVVLLYGGENYALAPDVTIEPPLFTSGQTATAEAIISANTGLITDVEMTDVGRYYIETPSISISNAEKISTSEYKFGNSSLYHSNNSIQTFGMEIPNVSVGNQNRVYLTFWYKPTESSTANSSILYSNNIMFYHRDDDRVVVRYANTEVTNSRASASVTSLNDTSIDTVSLDDVGLGYDQFNPPRVIFDNPDLPPATATADATKDSSNDTLSTVTLIDSGRYYQFAPDASITNSSDGISLDSVTGLESANGSLILNTDAVNQDYILPVVNSDVTNMNNGRIDLWLYFDPENLRAGTILEANNGNDWSLSVDALRRIVLSTPDGSNTVPIYTENEIEIGLEASWKFISIQKPVDGIDGKQKISVALDGRGDINANTREPFQNLDMEAKIATDTVLYSSSNPLTIKRTENTNYLLDVIRVNENLIEHDPETVLASIYEDSDTVAYKSFTKSVLSVIAEDGVVTEINLDVAGDCFGDPVVSIDAPSGQESDFNARANVLVAGNTSINAISGIIVSNTGLGYSTFPNIVIDRPKGFEVISADALTANNWNYVFFETVGDFAVITINGNSVGANGDVAAEQLSSDIQFDGGRLIYGYSNTDTQIFQGFVGYLDHVVFNETSDSFLSYDSKILPTTASQDLTDIITGETTDLVDRFDVTTVTPSVNNGIVESISFTSGIGYENTPTITIGAPTGNAQSFRATAEAVRIEGVTTEVNVTYGGNFYTREPRVTFTGVETVGTILFEDGDTFQLEEFRVEDVVASANNELFEEESVDFIDFSELNPFSEGSRW